MQDKTIFYPFNKLDTNLTSAFANSLIPDF